MPDNTITVELGPAPDGSGEWFLNTPAFEAQMTSGELLVLFHSLLDHYQLKTPMKSLNHELAVLFNRHSIDSATGMSDFVLSGYIMGQLDLLKQLHKDREAYASRTFKKHPLGEG